MARWSTPNRTRRNSAPAPTPSTRCSARRATPGICRAPPPAPRAAPPSRSPPARRGSPTAPTWAARCAIPRASAALSACGRASAASRIRRPPRSIAISAVQGPMARNVEDLALLLDAMSGEHPADPLSLPVLPMSFLSAARSGSKPKRVAYSPDLGITPGRSRGRRHHPQGGGALCRGRRDRRGSASRSARGP